MQNPKDYRQQIYNYVEGLLERPLSFEEHDDLRDMIDEYVFSMQNMSAMMRRLVCRHDWISDKKIQGGQGARAYVKCVKCDKRSFKRMPEVTFDV